MRLFAAIELDLAVTQKLVRLQQRLAVPDAGVRWLTPEQMHLTLKFLGEVPDDTVADVCEALRDIADDTPAFEFDVVGAGCFPKAGAVRIVWAGLREPTGVLAACREKCENVFASLGFKQEHRGFAPHLTIGRVKDGRLSARLREAVDRCTDFDGGRQGADELVLWESVLKREGARYLAVCRCPFADEADDDID